jgi:hypothetical protein
VDQAATYVREQANQPKHQQNYQDCPQHGQISFSDLLSGSSLGIGATFMPARRWAAEQLSGVFPHLPRGVLHHNRPFRNFVHPVLKLPVNLCFESGQTKLAARR